jgi:UDP-N-acetylglucosamine kinase
MNNTDLTNKEIEKIFKEQIVPQIIRDIVPLAEKKATILGGQPGSGKSALAREILRSNKNTVFINGDDLRPYHPKYFYYLKENDKEAADLTQHVCNLWVEKLITECVDRGLNVLVEGTMRKTEVPLNTARILKDAGYIIDVAVISTPYELSFLSLEIRYSELRKLGMVARFTKSNAHDEAFKKVEETLGELIETDLFNNFDIYLRTSKGFSRKQFTKEQKREILTSFREGRERIIEDKEKDRAHIFGFNKERHGDIH